MGNASRKRAKRRKDDHETLRKEKTLDKDVQDLGSEAPQNICKFTRADLGLLLKEKTYFTQGGFSRVYRAEIPPNFKEGLPSGEVVVKEFKVLLRGAAKQWEVEKNLLSSFSHPNIVKMIGYCDEAGDATARQHDTKAIVLEYLCNEDLHTFMFGDEERETRLPQPLPWKTRISILIDIAKAMKFLHDRNLIFQDLKPANILLDANHVAKLADFGTVINGPPENTEFIITDAAAGSKGYADPEYEKSGKASKAVDIYSFGVLLLEIILHRKAYKKNKPENRKLLTEKYKNKYVKRGNVHRRVSKKVQGFLTKNDLKRLLKLAQDCLNKTEKLRPTFDTILKTLREKIKQESCELGSQPVQEEIDGKMGGSPH